MIFIDKSGTRTIELQLHPPEAALEEVLAGLVGLSLLQTVYHLDAGSADLVEPLGQKSLASSQELIAADTQIQADIFTVPGSEIEI